MATQPYFASHFVVQPAADATCADEVVAAQAYPPQWVLADGGTKLQHTGGALLHNWEGPLERVVAVLSGNGRAVTGACTWNDDSGNVGRVSVEFGLVRSVTFTSISVPADVLEDGDLAPYAADCLDLVPRLIMAVAERLVAPQREHWLAQVQAALDKAARRIGPGQRPETVPAA